MNVKLIKILGLIASLGGAAAALLTDWVNDKRMDAMIDEKLAVLNEKEEES